MNSRIQPLDGLRAIAALGVLWIHIWTFYGNPSITIASVDVYQVMAILGNGVDFFFVISGFCMYLIMAKKNFGIKGYLPFLYKRFIRIAPAFYTAVIIYAILIKLANHQFDIGYNVFFHFLFLNNVVTGNSISGPFWSIGTEWHFYMVLPLFIFLSNKTNLLRAAVICSAFCLAFFAIVNLGYLSAGFWDTQIIVRFPEFAVGIIAADYFIKGYKLPGFAGRLPGIFLAILIMYFGRAMKFTPVVLAAGNAGFLLKTFADTIMVSGFGLLLYHVITTDSIFRKTLSKRFITWIGRISFSIYLWHSLSIIILQQWLLKLPFGKFNPFAGFLLVSFLTILVSIISYRCLEAFYFKKKVTGDPVPGLKTANQTKLF